MSVWKKTKTKTKHAGSIRQSQLITTFGVGAIVDFVLDTVIVAGIDNWDDTQRINNESLQNLTGKKYFVKPKTDIDNIKFNNISEDIPSYTFPEKMYCTSCHKIFDIREFKDNTYKCLCCTAKKLLTASRFVVVCENGHIEDFPYSWWVHKNKLCESGKHNQRIEMFNIGDRSGIDSLRLKCLDCGKMVSMAGAFLETAFSGDDGYKCKSNLPHLKDPLYFNNKQCNKPLKTVLRNSTRVHFPVMVSALSIPINNKNIKTTQKDIYTNEYIQLCKGNISDNIGEFKTHETIIPTKYEKYFDKIVVVEKLTEVKALFGFTRLKPYSGLLDDEKIVKLSIKEKEWLPAIKLNGEGIFIQFNSNKISEWEEDAYSRYEMLKTKLNNSYIRNDRFCSGDGRFKARYILLHSFAHLLIRQVSNECGYSTSSLREKIYSTFIDEDIFNMDMSGILIYTTTSDSDGSLGGLISIVSDKSRIEKILDKAILKATWCGADPLCINSTEQGTESLNYSACHDCLLLPETSCEISNILLDRASIVGSSEVGLKGFFV